MKTVQTQITDESNAKTQLFRGLFLLQMELDDHLNALENEREFHYHREVKELINSIDCLMELLINDQL